VKRVLPFLLVGLALIATSSIAIHAQTPAPDPTIRVGVVIAIRGAVNTYCVRLPAGATGLDALEATGVDLMAQRGPLGAMVCRVQKLGCTPPAEPCFCQCQGKACNYWAYFYRENGDSPAWVYSGLGLSSRRLVDGAMEGWLWSEGDQRTPAAALPTISVADICRAPLSAGPDVGGAMDALTVLGYVVFGAAGLSLIAAVWWRRRISSIIFFWLSRKGALTIF
jgi:hypothetical protein